MPSLEELELKEEVLEDSDSPPDQVIYLIRRQYARHRSSQDARDGGEQPGNLANEGCGVNGWMERWRRWR